MKASLIMLVVGMMASTTVMATTNEFGACAVMPNGGDVENGEIGWGVQGVIPLSTSTDVELAYSKFGDSLDITKMSISQLSASLRWNHSISERVSFYVGAGLNYNQLTTEIDNANIKVSMENAGGCHAVIGLKAALKDNVSLFIDYRFTRLETTAVVSGYGQSEVVEGTYNHGLARVGLNIKF